MAALSRTPLRRDGGCRRDRGIEISTPAALSSVDSLYIGTRALGPGEFDCEPVDAAGRCYDAERASFVVRLPEDERVDLDLSFEVITVVFQSQVFKVGTVFAGRVFDSTRLGPA